MVAFSHSSRRAWTTVCASADMASSTSRIVRGASRSSPVASFATESPSQRIVAVACEHDRGIDRLMKAGRARVQLEREGRAPLFVVWRRPLVGGDPPARPQTGNREGRRSPGPADHLQEATVLRRTSRLRQSPCGAAPHVKDFECRASARARFERRTPYPTRTPLPIVGEIWIRPRLAQALRGAKRFPGRGRSDLTPIVSRLSMRLGATR